MWKRRSKKLIQQPSKLNQANLHLDKAKPPCTNC